MFSNCLFQKIKTFSQIFNYYYLLVIREIEEKDQNCRPLLEILGRFLNTEQIRQSQ